MAKIVFDTLPHSDSGDGLESTADDHSGELGRFACHQVSTVLAVRVKGAAYADFPWSRRQREIKQIFR